MQLSIITINYNDQKGLEDTFKSVFAQTHQQFEYLVIDGGSTDGSKELIEQHADKIDYWVSEKDTGIFNAMNKGIKAAKGAYLLFLNSGDTFYNDEVLQQAVQQISNEHQIYYGDVQRVFNDATTTIKTYPKELKFSFFVDSAIAHQSAIVKRTLFDKVGYFNENYKIFADWEFFVCAICKYDVPYKHLGVIVANYDMGGVSSQSDAQLKYWGERELTYEKYFSPFKEDYKELMQLKALQKTNRMSLFLKLEQYPIARKMNHLFLKILNLFFREGAKN